MSRPRDYRAHGSAYDALMVGLGAHYLALLETAMLVDGEEIDTERATIEGMLADRLAGIHRPVTWRSIDRDVCTCSLVLPRGRALTETSGHVDAAFMLEGTIIVEDGELRSGSCQHCAATFRDDSLARLRHWQGVHVCPPDEPEEEPKVGPVDFRAHQVSADYFRSIIGAWQRRQHPRSDGLSGD